MLVLAAFPVSRMDKSVEIAELEFHGAAHPCRLRHGADLPDDPVAVRHASLMVIRDLENKQAVKIEFPALRQLDTSADFIERKLAYVNP